MWVDGDGRERTDTGPVGFAAPEEPLVKLLAHNLGLWQKLGQRRTAGSRQRGLLRPFETQDLGLGCYLLRKPGTDIS